MSGNSEVAAEQEKEIPVSTVPERKQRGRYKKRRDNSLPEEKVNQMFALYCNVPNFTYIARVAKVSIGTVRRYFVEHKWDQRREEIVAEARKVTDYDLQKATEDSIRILKLAKEKIERKIEKLSIDDMNPAFLVTDLERLVKMEQVLLGGVTDRTERINYSHEERIRKLREEKARLVNPQANPFVPSLTQPGRTVVLGTPNDPTEEVNNVSE